MGYIVIFKRLAGIPNVAVLVRSMVHYVCNVVPIRCVAYVAVTLVCSQTLELVRVCHAYIYIFI